MNLVDQIITEGARQFSLEDLEALVAEFPRLREELEKEPEDVGGMLDQFKFLRQVAEEAAIGLRREVALVALAEVAFALSYLANANDLIPDTLPHEGLIDDKAIFTAVLKRNAGTLQELAAVRGHDWEALTSVI